MPIKILVVDHDNSVSLKLQTAFCDAGVTLLLEQDGDSGLKRVLTERPNVAIIEMGLSPKSGIEVLKEAKRIDPGLAVIMATADRTTQNAIEAMKCGAFDYVTKPFNIPKLKEVVSKAVLCNQLSRRVLYTRECVKVEADLSEDLMIGCSPEMIEIWKMVGTVADSDATVLIQGESGTGKELLARAIYTNSKRKNRPFLAVNCAALPEALLESELFGHERGAFTDAVSRRIGKFEQCNGGTIFLDEIGDMSPANQAKFLRVLENQEFERVGGNETVKVDVRVISATNKSLLRAIKENNFRMDLFYRLRVINFYLPPLRDRAEDIPILVDYFVKKLSRKHGKDIKGVSPETMDLLSSHKFDGNIRELRNIINSATVLCRGSILMPEDFGSYLPHRAKKKAHFKGGDNDFREVFWDVLEPVFDGVDPEKGGGVYEALNLALEQVLIQMAMEKSNFNQVLAAKFLGISRNTLRHRLLRLPSGIKNHGPGESPGFAGSTG